MPFEFVTFVQLSSSRPCTPSQHPSLLLNLFFSALSLFFADPSLLSSPFPPFLVLLARKCHQNPHAIPLRPNRIPKLHPLRLPDLHRRGRPAFLERHDPSVGQVDGSSSLSPLTFIDVCCSCSYRLAFVRGLQLSGGIVFSVYEQAIALMGGRKTD
jgi:hypothetical protein